MTENPNRRFDPKEFKTEMDLPPEKESTEGSFLSKFIGDQKFVFSEKPLSDPDEHDQGVTRDKAFKSGTGELIFDTETISAAEKANIESFIKLVRDGGGKAALQGTKFEWFYGDESDEFLGNLADLLELRVDEIDNKIDKSSLASIGLNTKLVSAMDSFREMAKREQVKKAIDKQVEKLPIVRIEGLVKGGNGQLVTLRFNPSDINDPSNEVDILYINNANGEKELIISCKDPDKYDLIRPILLTEEAPGAKSKFQVVPGSFANIGDIDSETGRDFSRFEFEVEHRDGQVIELFTKVKVLKKPIDMDAQLKEYREEKNRQRIKEEAEEAARQAQAQAAKYNSQPPSVPSSSSYKWNQSPQTYTHSG